MTPTPAAASISSNALPLTATVGALGVVHGDIGTNALYALKEAAKAAAHGGCLRHCGAADGDHNAAGVLVAIQWGYPPVIVIAVNGFFFVIDCIFFAANSIKLFEGGWFPLLLAAVVAFLMLTWRSGVKLVKRARGASRKRI